MKKIDLGGISVLIVMVVKGSPTLPTIISLLRTVDALVKRGIDYDINFMIDGNVEYARTKAAHEFLKSGHHRMFCIDADMEWTADNFMRVLAMSMKMDIVGAFYTARCDPPKFFVNFNETENVTKGEITVMANEWGCLPARSGMGFVCCSRWAIQKVTDSMEKIKFTLSPEPMAHIFDCDVVDGEFLGEDMAFFARAQKIGIGVFYDPTITLGHVGSKTYRANFYDSMQQIASEAAE
jgi:hypothetical protein